MTKQLGTGKVAKLYGFGLLKAWRIDATEILQSLRSYRS